MYKIGQSNDIHNLKKNIFHKKKMIIGGTCIESDYRIKAYSDGDIILHSISEAIYGALSKGDLGKYFPENNKENKNLSSRKILKHALFMLKDENYEIVNIDFTVICEKVHFKNYKEKIVMTLNSLIPNTNINFKATRWESLGNTKIQSNCVVLIKKIDSKPSPISEDKMIEFIQYQNNKNITEIIEENASCDEIKNSSTTKKIDSFIKKINDDDVLLDEEIKNDDEKKSASKNKYSGNGYFKKIKRIHEE